MNHHRFGVLSFSLLVLGACSSKEPSLRVVEVSDAGIPDSIGFRSDRGADAAVDADAPADAGGGDAADGGSDAGPQIETSCTAPPTNYAQSVIAGLPSSITMMRVSEDGLMAVGMDQSLIPTVYERASTGAAFGNPSGYLPTDYDWEAGFSIATDGLQVTVVELGGRRLTSFRRAARGTSFVDRSGVPLDARRNNPVFLSATDKLSDPVLMSRGTTALVRVNLSTGAARGVYQVSTDPNSAGTGNNDLISYGVNPFGAYPNARLTGYDDDQYALYFAAGGSSYVTSRPDYLVAFGTPALLGSFTHATPGRLCGAVYAVSAAGPIVRRAR